MRQSTATGFMTQSQVEFFAETEVLSALVFTLCEMTSLYVIVAPEDFGVMNA